MCGLTGFLTSRPESEARLVEQVTAMADTLRHRGPDDGASWVEPTAGVALGFRRLAIVDLSPLGRQPMTSASGRFTMAFNGEIYNFAVIRRDLEARGARFRGHSDTEVLLAGFDAWGIRATIERAVGMFAMAVWDGERRELTLIRDRLGKKPLFIYAEPGYLGFASELKALRAGPRFDPVLDRTALLEYLRYLYVPAPRSIYQRVIKLLPGAMVTIRSADLPLPDQERYWTVEEARRRGLAMPFPGDESAATDAFEELLTEAVSLRMYADVPVGALLSGGIDSSAVVALMQSVAARPVKTYTIGFEERAYDEAHHAAAVAAHLGTDHTSLRLTGGDAVALVPRLAEWYDEPLADPSQLPTFLICQLARRDVTVALTGDGGDELFAGYNRYAVGQRLLTSAARTPGPLRAGLGRLALAVGARGGDPRSVAGRVRKAGEVFLAPSLGEGYRSLLSAWQRPGELVPGVAEPPGPFLAGLGGAGGSLLGRMMAVDQASYLPDDLLAKLDRASMAVSLEARAPILDHRVAEFSWTLPDRLKLRGRETKWILRQVLYRKVPRELVERPKMGFSVPISAWLRGPLRDWGEGLLARVDTIEGLAPAPCRAAWASLQAGSEHRSLGLWALLVFLDWHRRWLA